jgi:hypothetical protein
MIPAMKKLIGSAQAWGITFDAVTLKRLSVAAFCVLAVPPAAGAVEANLVAGYGVVGPKQFDAGGMHGVIAANLTGIHLSPALSMGGIGYAVRGGTGIFKDADEAGVNLPVLTYHRRFGVAQLGVQMQRFVFTKNTYFVGFGFGFGYHGTPRTPPRDTRK